MKRWVIVVMVLLAIALATHLWGSLLIRFAVVNDKTVDSVKKLVELLALLAGFGTAVIKWGFGAKGEPTKPEPTPLPEFTIIRLFPPDQPEDIAPWKPMDSAVEFHRTFEFAADPVFDITVENKSSQSVLIHGVGLHLVQRTQGVGGIRGYPQPVPVQASLRIKCPDEWKQAWGAINAKTRPSEFAAPIEMKVGDSPFRFTLMLENFCDTDSASRCEVRFYLETGVGMAESRSIWLSQ